MECLQCGTCCVAPDISTLGKGVGERCRHLLDSFQCGIYPERPEVCRGYRPDKICAQIAAPDLEERVAAYLALFGLEPSPKRSRVNSPSSHCA
ncbi:MAG TPA: YkgJ family cysteine cluster protein [Geomonas sp.]|nr:YkgJ family cysteine cluster protein [Geomonas sp.]